MELPLEKAQEFYIRVPIKEGFDFPDLNIKIDTWIFQDLEDTKKRNAGELDKANSQEVEVLRQRIKQLENSEQEWQANVSTHLKSESALKCR